MYDLLLYTYLVQNLPLYSLDSLLIVPVCRLAPSRCVSFAQYESDSSSKRSFLWLWRLDGAAISTCSSSLYDEAIRTGR